MAFNDDEKPPVAAGSNQGVVTMQIPKYSKPEVALTTTDSVTAVVEIEAASSASVREGLDLVAVLDVSGSMSGRMMESMKKALQFVIMKLTPMDRLSLVTFCTRDAERAERLTPLRSMTKDAQDDAKRIVQDYPKAYGGTDIEAGLDLGLAVIRDRVYTESRTASIFLMTDGKHKGNLGRATKDDTGEVSVYTFGFGDDAMQVDHKLLSDIAKNSIGGTYSAVPNWTKLSAHVSLLLGGLLTVVAQDVKLTLTPNTDDGDLVNMEVLPGTDTDYKHATDDKGVITIKFGTLFSGEVRKVAVNFTLKESASTTKAYSATLAVVQHSYAAHGTVHLPAQQHIRIRRTPNPTTPHSAGIEERWSVQAEVVRRQHADLISEVSKVADEATMLSHQADKLLDDKKLDEARRKRQQANQKLVNAQGVLQEAQNKLMDIMLDDGDNMLGNALRHELGKLLGYMRTAADYDTLGRPYALATIISHGRQRAAGRGDEAIIENRLYVTPRMITYLEQANKFEQNPQEPVRSADEDVKEEVAANST